MANFCRPDADGSLDKAIDDAQTSVISGEHDPTVDATKATKGTLFIRVGASGGKCYQKQDTIFFHFPHRIIQLCIK